MIHVHVNKAVSDAEDFRALEGISYLKSFVTSKCFTWWFH